MKDWSKQTVVQLKAELKRRGLGQAGLKQELVTRLTEDDAAAVAANEAEVASESEPAENPDPQPADLAEPTGNAPPIDAIPKDDRASAGPELIPAEEEAQSTPEVSTRELNQPVNQDEPAAIAEAMEPTLPAPTEIIQDAHKRKRRSESPPASSESVSSKRLRIEADQEGEAQSSELSGVSGVISKIKEGTTEVLEGGTSLVDDAANAAKDISENMVKPSQGEPTQQGQPTETEEGTKDVAMKMTEEDVNGKAREDSPVDAPATEKSKDADHISRDDSDQHRERQDTSGPAQKSAFVQDNGDDMEYERDVQPSVHPATRALYIKNFMRPLRENVVQARLLELATPVGADPDDNDIEEFYLDQIRTHAFVVFRTTTQASRVRKAMHDVIWPDERERKPLWVDFVPPERVRDWIHEEEVQGSRRRGARWEILYDHEDDGFVVARLDSGTALPSASSAPEPARTAPSGPSIKDANAIPLGPRGGRGTDGAPLGPRGDSMRGPGSRPPRQIPGFPGGPVQTTRQNPPISYQLVSEDLASRRIRNMQSFYTRDLKRDMGPESDINRYTFEQGDSFVDRGQEVFVGIRPPHREANRRRRIPAGGGGGPPPSRLPPRSRRGGGNRRGPRPLSDRYLPGINESGPYRQGDRGNFGGSRFDDDRDRRY